MAYKRRFRVICTDVCPPPVEFDFREIFPELLDAGAISVSGAGGLVYAVCPNDRRIVTAVRKAIKRHLEARNISASVYTI